MEKRIIKKLHKWLRYLIQMVFFVCLPSAFTAGFSGVKYIFSSLSKGEKIEYTAFLHTMLLLCVFTIIFGRFFCGYACAFGSIGDAGHGGFIWICKKLKKKVKPIPDTFAEYLLGIKYIILAAIAILCFAGAFDRAKGSSPWDVFSMIRAGNFRLEGYGVGMSILFIIFIGMMLEERFFCRFFCPMGAVFSLLPTLPFFTLKRNREQCLQGCKGCKTVCPSGISLPEEGSIEVKGECFVCEKCLNVCPKQNIHYEIVRLQGKELYFTIFRAILLFVLLLWAGV